MFRDYLQFGQSSLLNRLVWSPRLGEVLNLAATVMNTGPGAASLVLPLLRACQSKLRSQVLPIAFKHYEIFANVDYRDLIRVVCQARLPEKWMREEAEHHLRADLGNPHRHELAMKWLDRLLEDD
jgi:hypothetical protein